MQTPDPKPGEPLSKCELKICNFLISTPLTQAQIGEKICRSERTVKWHARRVYIKLGVSNRLELIFKERKELAA
tara:strand:- start:6690 stop:6911 length:222 start_codon:yes stop_codon:yes gene_type:complete